MTHSDPSFLSIYEEFASSNEAPEIFHTWAGLSVLSAVIGRRVWINRGSVPPVYCNMYIVLTSPPGTKKTTALMIARDVVEQVKTIPLAGTTVTKEQIIVTMDTQKDDGACKRVFRYNGHPVTFSHYCIFASEFVNQINAGMNPIGMIDFLTDMWDKKMFSDETKNRGKFMIEHPYLTMLAAMTDKTARNLNDQKIVSAGMLRRCLFIMGQDSGKDVARPDLIFSERHEQLRKLAQEHLKQLEFVSGPFGWTDEASEAWDQIYLKNGMLRRKEKSPLKAEFYQTRPEYIQKVAMLLQLSQNPKELLLTAPNLRKAEIMVTSVENGVIQLFEGSGRNETNVFAVDIVNMCEANPPYVEKVLYSQFMNHLKWDEFKDAVEGMIRVDKLYRWTDIKDGGLTVVYISTPLKISELRKARKQPGMASLGLPPLLGLSVPHADMGFHTALRGRASHNPATSESDQSPTGA